MANTSGSVNTVVVTRDQLITDALTDMGVYGYPDTIPAADITGAALKLNFCIKKWATKGLLQWCRDTISIPMQANKFVYTIGPVGADVTSYRPLRAMEGTFIRQVVGTTNIDTPLIILSRLEYQQETNKGVGGVPNSVYYQPTMGGGTSAYNPANSPGTLSVFVSPLDATRTVFLEVQRPIQDVLAAGDAFDFPLEWYEAITKGLAAALVGKYEVPLDRRRMIKDEAKEALDEIVDWSATEEAPFWFAPDPQMYDR